MSKLIALVQFLLMLSGCDIGGSTFSNRMSVDGRDTLDSRVRVQAGIARFTCTASASGRCHYLLFAEPAGSACHPGAPRRAGAPCAPAALRRFVVTAGNTLAVAGLPAFQLCVSTDGLAQPDACSQLRQPAATAASG